MPLWQEIKNRVRYLGRRSRFDEELEHEIQFHIETRAAELEQSGIPSPDAVLQARREFGSSARVRENTREAWHFHWLEDLFADLRYAARAFRRSPGFTLTALLSLALGIGANSAIFTAADAVLWKPLPVKDPQSLVRFSGLRENRHETDSIPAKFVDEIRRSSTVFSELVTDSADGLTLSLDSRAERIMGAAVSPNFFRFLGVRAFLGHAFSQDVENSRWAAQAVLSYGFWRRRFAGDEHVLGRTVHINSYPFTIVGVAPAGFFGVDVGMEPELWLPRMPLGQELSQIRLISATGNRSWNTIARLKPGVSRLQAEAATKAQFQQFLHDVGGSQFTDGRIQHVRLLPGGRGYAGFVAQFQQPLFMLLALVALVLLIACANVANMLLARATARRRELGVRASIGAGRVRLIRQMLAESALLSCLGGALGLAVASWANQVVLRILPQGHIRMVLDLRPDLRALLFTFGIALVTGILFGLIPALSATRGDLAGTLKTDSAGAIGGSGGSAFRKSLVVSQIALSVLLLMLAGLFVRTMENLRATDYGYQPDHVLLFMMKPQVELYKPEQIRKMTAELVRRVAALPGVQSAALAENGPLSSRVSTGLVQVPGGEPVPSTVDNVSPHFFETINIPQVAGRDFTPGDQPGSPLVALVNDVLARALFKNENPIGRSIQMVNTRPPVQYRIIGVVRGSRYYDLHTPPPPAVYLAIQQETAYMPTLHVRSASGNSADVVAAVRHEFEMLDKDVPVFSIKALDDRVDDSLARERLVSALAGAFGVLALVLAAVGLYGVMAYTVTRRTREIGIRMALGSSSYSALWLVAKEAFLLAGIGMAAGLTTGLIAARFVSNQLFAVSAADPITIAGSVAALIAAVGVAISIPARRASKVDPLVALRYE